MSDKLDGNRARVVENGLAMFQQVSQEAEHLDKELNKQLELIARLRAELDAMHQHQAILESRCATCEAARDQAVAERAVYEVLFASFKAQLNAFKIPDTLDNLEEVEEPQMPKIDWGKKTGPAPARSLHQLSGRGAPGSGGDQP